MKGQKASYAVTRKYLMPFDGIHSLIAGAVAATYLGLLDTLFLPLAHSICQSRHR
jgi:hypothetical protein